MLRSIKESNRSQKDHHSITKSAPIDLKDAREKYIVKHDQKAPSRAESLNQNLSLIEYFERRLEAEKEEAKKLLEAEKAEAKMRHEELSNTIEYGFEVLSSGTIKRISEFQ